MGIVEVFFFILGLFFGSFFNVLVDRIPRGESVLKGRSHCDKCHKTLQWYDLIPLFSFLSAGGKCRYCHTSLSYYYPLSEVVTGILFAFTFFTVSQNYQLRIINYEFILALIYSLFVVSSFFVIFFTDLKYGIIPDKILFPSIAITVFYILFFHTSLLLTNLLSGVIAYAFFYVIYFVTRKKGIGFGDVKLALWLGLLLGFPGIVVALYIAFISGALVALLLIISGRKKLHGSSIPFGPFMILGAFLLFFWPNNILAMLSRFFL